MEDELKELTQHYHNPEETQQDIKRVLSLYTGLIPKRDTFTFNNGNQAMLVNLSGTIPVRYRGAVYNIPVVIWIMDTHPINAPICYVKPTSNMSISVSMYVDENGKIYLPYLHDWVPNGSDLLSLIQIMICIFGEKPPVLAKPTNVPYPPYMPQTSNTGFPPFQPTPYPSQMPGFGSQLPYPMASTGNMPYPSYPTPYPPFSGASSYGSPMSSTNNSGTIKDEHIHESLLTAIEEKLLRKMRERFSQNQAELETLKRTQQQLRQGMSKLDSVLEQMAKEKSDLDKNITVLKDKESELDKAIERLSNQESIDVDDAVTTTAPLYKQLLNVFAEEAALEDAIYYMGEALRCGVIDLDVFLRQVRTLSRKQFMMRALMQKCRQKAGLPAI